MHIKKLVSEEYTELMHYTTLAGLAGIVTSGSLWATHASFLNDVEEMTHFFDARLPLIVRPEVRKRYEEIARQQSIAIDMTTEREMDNTFANHVEKTVSSIRDKTLSFNQPYIFSMSASHNKRISENGLLSQWRGYGVDGGYSIIFDTSALEKMLKVEADSYHYQHLQFGDVYYYGNNDSNQPSSQDISEFEETVRSNVASLIRTGEVADNLRFYQAITSLSCLYKHWGFYEEHEVRVIAVVAEPTVAKLAAANGETKPQKKVRTFLRGGMPVPFIDLFAVINPDAPVTRLPITRILVGPHRDSVFRQSAVKKLLAANGYDCEVVCSKIPYIGF